MNYFLRLLLTNLIATIMLGATRADQDIKQFSLNHVAQVQKRYFLVRRLEKAVLTFQENQWLLGKAAHTLLSDIPNKTFFSHPAVRAVANEITSLNTCTPFAKVWDDFLSYRYLESDVFVRELIVLLIFLYKDIIGAATHDRSIDSIFIQQCIDTIIQNKESILGGTQNIHELESPQFMPDTTTRSQYPKPELTAILTEHHTFKELYHDESANLGTHFTDLLAVLDLTNQCCDFVVYNNIRFFHIQRLLRSIFVLARSDYTVVPFCVEINGYFKHSEILASAQEMCNSQDIIPLLKLWKRFSSYEFIDDELFVHEYLRLLCIAYAHIKTEEQLAINKDVAIEDVIALYEKVQDLPINDLLNLLDEMVEHFEHVSENYEIHDQTLTWKQWFKKYWWAPPVIVGSFLLILLKHRHLFGYLSKHNYHSSTGIGGIGAKPPTIGIPVSSHNFEIV